MADDIAKPQAEVGSRSEVHLPQGPLKQTMRRFERILSVPVALQNEFFRWQSEFDVCERATHIGQALDIITEIYRQFLSQFSAVSDTRMRLMQSPSHYMVTPMYYCDRALNSLVHAIAEVRAGINTLYDQLRDVYDVVIQKCDSAEKMYREVELAAKSDMAHFVQERKAKATVLRELSERICSVRDGGTSMFLFLDKSWCISSSLCTKILGTQLPNLHPSAGQASQAEQIVIGNEKSAEMMPRTPDEQPRNSTPPKQTIRLGKTPGDVPETPETRRVPDNEAPRTQVSSPRQRSSSARKRSRALLIASRGQIDGDGPPVGRNLALESSQAGDELNTRQKMSN